MMNQYVLCPAYAPTLAPDVIEWLEANDIPISRVPADTYARVDTETNTITIEQFVINPITGKRVVGPTLDSDATGFVTERHNYPVRRSFRDFGIQPVSSIEDLRKLRDSLTTEVARLTNQIIDMAEAAMDDSSGEDADAPRPDQQAENDQDDTPQVLAPEQRDDASDD